MASTSGGGLNSYFNAGSSSGSADCYSDGVQTITSASSLFPESFGISGGKPRTYRVNRHGSQQGGFKFSQEPVAVVSMACRLPDECNSPRALWRFLERGSVARNTPPATRFNLGTHHDGSLRRQTMPSPGGMFLQGVDPRNMDAQFFRLSTVEAASMDPQQRQLLEIVYEGLENAGITMEELDGARVGCFVGSFACDYGDIQARDPEQRAAAAQVGIGRAMLSNRISHFFNLKGPSITVDTACSGSLTCVDLACRYLQTREIESAVVAAANIYLSPEHVMDHYMGAEGTASLSGRCHTFDAKADGYIKAEAVNMLYLKRLDDAIRDGDPIRAIIRGSATNSDGWTAGIASPNPEAQSAVIRQAYANAGITDLSLTSYVEFHGTGTRAGDAIEAAGVASVFTPFRTAHDPLPVGSIKANVGHSEPAAGISAMIKVILSLENAVIPGNPTFITPNPKIDFDKLRIAPSRYARRWHSQAFRRASVNSFGYGGSNAHVVVDEYRGASNHVTSYAAVDVDDLFTEDEQQSRRPHLLVFSANDQQSLESQFSALDRHLSDPAVSIRLRDLAYTLSERRSRHYHRAYTLADDLRLEPQTLQWGTAMAEPPKIGLIMTGQGAQWSEMGKDLLEFFPAAACRVQQLDEVLQNLPDPPEWSLIDELKDPRSARHLQLPNISQPLVTALQLGLLAILEEAGLQCHAVVGHSSGEIAAAVAAGWLTPEQAIMVAYYRGKAISEALPSGSFGMMAVGLDPGAVSVYLEGTSVEIGCINSPNSITLSGRTSELSELEKTLTDKGHFARRIRVDVAYHSRYMKEAAERYMVMLTDNVPGLSTIAKKGQLMAQMYSSTTGEMVLSPLGPSYWAKNMSSTVLFHQALHSMIAQDKGVDQVIEIGPSSALAGPVGQTMKAAGSAVPYASAWARGPRAMRTLLQLAGRLFTMGCPVSLAPFNQDDDIEAPRFISDLPNYCWNHSAKYWHETAASRDWRFRRFLHHDLLGSKILGTPWKHPVWKKTMRLADVTWLRDHQLGESIVFPGAGYLAMAMEAIFQKSAATGRLPSDAAVNSVTFKLRNVYFHRMLTLDESRGTTMELSLRACYSTRDTWHEFVISSVAEEAEDESTELCRGLVTIGEHAGRERVVPVEVVQPLVRPQPASVWYKAMSDVGLRFGPAFKRQTAVEATAGSRTSRARIDLAAPESRFPQSSYPLHPTVLDACFQTSTPSLSSGHKSAVAMLSIPAMIDDLVVFSQGGDGQKSPERGIAVSTAKWSGEGRRDDPKQLMVDVKAYDEEKGRMLLHLQGLRFHMMQSPVPKKAPHSYAKVVWREDVHFLTPRQVGDLLMLENQPLGKIAKVAQLCAHKNPSARILEVELAGGSGDSNNSATLGRSIWIDKVRDTAGQPAKNCAFRLSLSSQMAGMEARRRYTTESNIDYAFHDPSRPFEEQIAEDEEEKSDLILLRLPFQYQMDLDLNLILEGFRTKLTPHGYLICLQDCSALSPNCSNLAPLYQLEPRGYTAISGLHGACMPRILYMGTPSREPAIRLQGEETIHIVHMHPVGRGKGQIRDFLADRGWSVIEHSLPLDDKLPAQSTVLVLDEMFSPVLSNMTEDQHDAMRRLLARNCRLVWVTMGAQMKIDHPEHGLIYGTARTLLLEHPTNLVLCLDVERNNSYASFEAINVAVRHINSVNDLKQVDSEFVERGGRYYISRIVTDAAVNRAEQAVQEGNECVPTVIRGHESTIRLISDRRGTLDSLVYAVQADNGKLPLGDDEVEVEICAAALNFKDLANAMGFVPANDHFFGLEGAGIVSKIGKSVHNVQPGDRVSVVSTGEQGCFANRVRTRYHGVHRIPHWMSFEEAAGISTCYLTVIHCLVNLASIKRGQSVLVHSATGGVGLAAVQFCNYVGAEVYATVGTDAKRAFLTEGYGIPDHHIFSSRSTDFAAQLMTATNGRGVDVVLNSLTGDMLHESWRCIAENGTFLEIGKRDLVDRSSLSMEPFNRNASYRAVDMSRKGMPANVIFMLGKYLMEKITHGHLKPIHLCKVFSFRETVEAFRYMHQGKQLGKVVISYQDSGTVALPVRPLAPQLQLRPDRSYLIVGGLKGLCGSLAVYMARNGARNVIAMARSGFDDPATQAVMDDLKALGCHVDLVVGDVTVLSDVRRAFQQAPSRPVAGVIQGAMVLRDRMFANMTAAEFREPLAPKVRGTWNLHIVSLEQKTPLDFFTMLASVSGVVGHISQSNYAAGNVFQDNVAAYRRQRGLPACTVDLGLVGDVGYLAEHKLMPRLEAQGWTPISEALLHRILCVSILQQQMPACKDKEDQTGQIITGITVPIIPPHSPLDPVHRLSTLGVSAAEVSRGRKGPGEEAAADGVDPKLAILKSVRKGDGGGAAKYDLALAAAVDVINSVLARSLGATAPLEPQRPLASYGIDSLVAVELRNWVRKELALEISGLEVVGAKTLVALCEVILKKMGAGTGSLA